METKPHISLIIPVFNEQENIRNLYDRLVNVVEKISDQYLNKFNSEKKDIFNKVIFRNTVKDFFKIISLD